MKTEKVKLSKKSTARLRQRYHQRFGYHKPMPGYSGGTEAKKHLATPNSVVALLPAVPLLPAPERRGYKKKSVLFKKSQILKIDGRAKHSDFFSDTRRNVNYC